jgi:hypothetical protein
MRCSTLALMRGQPMSDQQQTPLHKWEIVSQGENATTYRMRVPGGWLAV